MVVSHPWRVVSSCSILLISAISLAGVVSSSEPSAPEKAVPRELIDDINERRDQMHYGWLCGELAKVALAVNDTKTAESALRSISDSGKRRLAIRSLPAALLTNRNQEEVLNILAVVESWNVAGNRSPRPENDISRATVNELLRRGEFHLAHKVVATRNVSPPVALLIADGKISEALTAYSDESASSNIDTAVGLAAGVAATGKREHAINFLVRGWPTRSSEWSIALCLQLASSDEDMTPYLDLCEDPLRRQVLGRACAELRQWKSLYRQSLDGATDRVDYPTLNVNNVLAVAHLLASLNMTKSPLPSTVEGVVGDILDLPSPAATDITRVDRQLMLQELVYFRLIRHEGDALLRDVRRAQTSLGATDVLAAQEKAMERYTLTAGPVKATALTSEIQDQDSRIALHLGILRAEYGIKENAATIGERILNQRVEQIRAILMDPILNK